MKDWRPAIARMVEVKRVLAEVDTDGLWEHHPPRAAATEEDIAAVEARLGLRLDPQYREFLLHANGWPSFFHTIDLFGTEELAGGGLMDVANEMLDASDPIVWEQTGLDRQSLLPIAATMTARDMFVMPVQDAQQVAPVVWLDLPEIETFPSFERCFQAMIEQNELEATELREEGAPP
jgi:SMI1-KNR4 cell-wall